MEPTYEVILDGGGPWGFRLQGGKDFGIPLNIARITPGSKAAVKNIMVGDTILEINGTPTEHLSHMEAQNVIKNSGGRLELKLRQGSGVSIGDQNARAMGAAAAQPKVLISTDVTHSAGVDYKFNAKPRPFFSSGEPVVATASVSTSREAPKPVVQAPKFSAASYAHKKKEELERRQNEKVSMEDSEVLKMIQKSKISDERPPQPFNGNVQVQKQDDVSPASKGVIESIKERQNQTGSGLSNESKVPSRVFQMLQKQYDDEEEQGKEGPMREVPPQPPPPPVSAPVPPSPTGRAAKTKKAAEPLSKKKVGLGPQDLISSLKQHFKETHRGDSDSSDADSSSENRAQLGRVLPSTDRPATAMAGPALPPCAPLPPDVDGPVFRMVYESKDIKQVPRRGLDLIDSLKLKMSSEKSGLSTARRMPSQIYKMLQEQYGVEDAPDPAKAQEQLATDEYGDESEWFPATRNSNIHSGEERRKKAVMRTNSYCEGLKLDNADDLIAKARLRLDSLRKKQECEESLQNKAMEMNCEGIDSQGADDDWNHRLRHLQERYLGSSIDQSSGDEIFLDEDKEEKEKKKIEQLRRLQERYADPPSTPPPSPAMPPYGRTNFNTETTLENTSGSHGDQLLSSSTDNEDMVVERTLPMYSVGVAQVEQCYQVNSYWSGGVTSPRAAAPSITASTSRDRQPRTTSNESTCSNTTPGKGGEHVTDQRPMRHAILNSENPPYNSGTSPTVNRKGFQGKSDLNGNSLGLESSFKTDFPKTPVERHLSNVKGFTTDPSPAKSTISSTPALSQSSIGWDGKSENSTQQIASRTSRIPSPNSELKQPPPTAPKPSRKHSQEQVVSKRESPERSDSKKVGPPVPPKALQRTKSLPSTTSRQNMSPVPNPSPQILDKVANANDGHQVFKKPAPPVAPKQQAAFGKVSNEKTGAPAKTAECRPTESTADLFARLDDHEKEDFLEIMKEMYARDDNFGEEDAHKILVEMINSRQPQAKARNNDNLNTSDFEFSFSDVFEMMDEQQRLRYVTVLRQMDMSVIDSLSERDLLSIINEMFDIQKLVASSGKGGSKQRRESIEKRFQDWRMRRLTEESTESELSDSRDDQHGSYTNGLFDGGNSISHLGQGNNTETLATERKVNENCQSRTVEDIQSSEPLTDLSDRVKGDSESEEELGTLRRRQRRSSENETKSKSQKLEGIATSSPPQSCHVMPENSSVEDKVIISDIDASNEHATNSTVAHTASSNRVSVPCDISPNLRGNQSLANTQPTTPKANNENKRRNPERTQVTDGRSSTSFTVQSVKKESVSTAVKDTTTSEASLGTNDELAGVKIQRRPSRQETVYTSRSKSSHTVETDGGFDRSHSPVGSVNVIIGGNERTESAAPSRDKTDLSTKSESSNMRVVAKPSSVVGSPSKYSTNLSRRRLSSSRRIDQDSDSESEDESGATIWICQRADTVIDKYEATAKSSSRGDKEAEAPQTGKVVFVTDEEPPSDAIRVRPMKYKEWDQGQASTDSSSSGRSSVTARSDVSLRRKMYKASPSYSSFQTTSFDNESEFGSDPFDTEEENEIRIDAGHGMVSTIQVNPVGLGRDIKIVPSSQSSSRITASGVMTTIEPDGNAFYVRPSSGFEGRRRGSLSSQSSISYGEDSFEVSNVSYTRPHQNAETKSKSDAVQVRIPIGIGVKVVSRGADNLPPPPPELMGGDTDEKVPGIQSRTFMRLQQAVDSGEGDKVGTVFNQPPGQRGKGVPMPNSSANFGPKASQTTTVNAIPKPPMPGGGSSPSGPNFRITTPKAPTVNRSPTAPSYNKSPSSYSSPDYTSPQSHASHTVHTRSSPKPVSPAESGRTPRCYSCDELIRGPFVSAIGKTWHPEHFCCASCHSSLQNQGFVEEQSKLYCEKCFNDFFAPKCAACGKSIVGNCINAIGKAFHPEHFVCTKCGKPFGNEGFLIEGGKPYCEADYDEMFGVKCAQCHKSITGGERYVEALDKNWHSECFSCGVCHTKLEGSSFYVVQGRPYCGQHKSGY